MAAIYESHAYPSYSQAGEDRIIHYFLGCIGREEGVRYIDIGASSPAGHNNTYLFYTLGGSGVLVEADPMYLPAYQAIRPKDLVENVAVVPTRMRDEQTVTFYRMENRGWSSVSPEHVSVGSQLGKSGVVTPIKVPCLTLNELLQKHSTDIDVLSVDIEGVDVEVISELDFDRFRPRVVVIENAGLATESTDPQFRRLESHSWFNGYTLFASTFVNSIFVRRDCMELFRP
jgi:FkbM family methyltransferase